MELGVSCLRKEVIFLIEDDDNYIELYQQVLKDEFKCFSFTNAQDALAAFALHQPKSIVLDLNLPDMNGIEFCSKLLNKKDKNSRVDVIFVSGESDTNVKLKAFEVGAADFIVKPFELKELLFKVRSSVRRKLNEESLNKDVADSQLLIYNTMEQASQYSNVMNFFKQLSHCKSIVHVVDVFFKTMTLFNLACSIRVSIPSVMHFRSDKHEVPPIEQDIYELLHNKGRIFPFSNRLIINDKHVSFIIKNPPADDHELGQVRDYVAAIIEGLEAKVLELYSQSGMTSAITGLSGNINELKMGIQEHNRIINSVMSNMMLEISGSFHALEMTEQQESFLNDLIEKGNEQLSHAEQHLVNIMGGLETIKENMIMVQDAVQEEMPEPVIQDDEIELF